MKKVIYTKYSNQRKREYKIATSIIDIENDRHVYKWSLYDEGALHVLGMVETREKLDEIFDKSNWRVAECRKIEDNMIDMEYIDGITVENYINSHILDGEIEEAIQCIKEISLSIYGNGNLREFQRNEQFKNIFGNISFSHQLHAFEYSNVDLIFSNLIYGKDGVTIIDYEWFFDFQIPIEFILFRSVFHNALIDNLRKEDKERIYNTLHINEDDVEVFERMEYAFQAYVKGDELDFEKLHKVIGQDVVSLDDLLSDLDQSREARVQYENAYWEYRKAYEQVSKELDAIHANIIWKIGDKLKSVTRKKN